MNTDKLSLPENTRAISSVVGVALMVGIVVVLSGVIGFAVLDFGDDIGAEPTASVSVEETSEDNFRVTWVSQGNADYLVGNSQNGSFSGAPGSGDAGSAPDVNAGEGNVLTEPGQSMTVDLSGSDANSATVSAGIADNPEDSTAVIRIIEP